MLKSKFYIMKKIFCGVCFLLLTFNFSYSQRGTISGKITDSKTKVGLPGVNVMIKGTYYGASSDVDGNYTIQNINPGIYTLTFTIIGYTSVTRTGVKVEADKKLNISLDLSETVLTLGQEVLIVGEKPLLNIEETSSRRSISAQDIEVAVVEDIKDVVSLQVGVVKTDNEIHIRGGRSYENAYLLDGISVQDPLAGTGFGLQLSAASVKEVEVITGGFNAEYGQATSGIVNVTTKDGTDSYNAYLSYKGDHLISGKNSPSNFNTDIAEANISGPEPITKFLLPALGINIPGSITFFGNFYMGISDGFITAESQHKAKQLYSSTFYGTRFAPREGNNWFWLAKLTWKPNAESKLTYSFNQSVSIGQNTQMLQTNLEYVEPSPGYQYIFQNILDNSNTFTHDNIFHTLYWLQTVSNKMFYELKITRFFTNLRADANGKNWNQYTEPKDIVTFPIQYYDTHNPNKIGVIPGDGFFDVGNASTWHDHYLKEFTFKGDLTYIFNEKNKFKGGFETSFQEMQLIDIYAPWVGTMGYNNDIYKVYPAFGDIYAQDNITFSGMILNAGLRFDYWFPGKYVDDAIANPEVITIPKEIRARYIQDTYNFLGRRFKARLSPRLGISHPISDNQTLFFSYGHFSKRPKPQFIYAKLNPTSAKSTFQTFGNPDLNPETTVAYELGIRNQFTDNDVFSLTAYYKDIFDYVSTRSAKISDARFAGGNFITYVNQDYARSRGVELEYKKRFGKWFNGSFTASYSIATGKSSSADEGVLIAKGDIFETVKENFLIWDRPFQVSLNTNFIVPKNEPLFGILPGILEDYNLYLRFFYQSGKRYTPMIFVGYLDNGRPEYMTDTKNLYSKLGQYWFWIDLNFEKYFTIGQLDFSFHVEITNLLNNRNAAIINPVTGKAYELGDPTPLSYNDPLFPDLQAPISPFPFDPSRYLEQRNIKIGISMKF
jgi:outer membrane receptor protein involved in Fe transport